MKKLFFLFAITLFISTSCDKEDETPTYTQEQLNGTWETVVADEDGCVNQLEITDNSMNETTICTGGTIGITYDNYSFDGKEISAEVWGFTVKFKIKELTDTKLILSDMTDEQTEYKRIEK